MTDKVLYYPARLAGEHASAQAALESVGFPSLDAELVISNAAANASNVIVVGLSNGKGIALQPTEHGRVQLWQAMLGEASADYSEAEAFAEDLQKALNDGSTVAVFEWVQPISSMSH